jgi:hypothetical protein
LGAGDGAAYGRGREHLLDNLTVALCISIGTGVPWLMAVYSEDRARQLIENNVLGLTAAGLAAVAFDWLFSTYSVVALVSLGPPAVVLAIAAGQAVKRAILSRLSRSPY